MKKQFIYMKSEEQTRLNKHTILQNLSATQTCKAKARHQNPAGMNVRSLI